MTRSKIQKLKFFVFLLIFLLAQTAVCDGIVREKRDAPSTNVNGRAAVPVADVNAGTKNERLPDDKDGQRNAAAPPSVDARKPAPEGNRTHDVRITSKAPDVANKTAHTVDTSNESSEGHTSFNTGALLRGFLVFVGLSILVMAYIVFRSFRLSKTRAQLVRKYGVLTHRQDVEMRPLPLEEEDDEDTTVFDASNVVTINAQHQNI
ncbi:PREDICTED: membrane protein FAM174-like [Wasmannia auropunctata]|uniref:membrane protein FAM174-like n=1 Tax=Wasmannia auropunctata TaxID=64793 RepID=UPI0005F092BC|nr:PREDICTED: membrane protein FAM174-like [Wasmannia auropunctata]